MDEELMDIVTEQNVDVQLSETTDVNVTIEDEIYDVEPKETVDVIEAEMPETIEIEIEESIGWVGGDSERHYSLLGRDERDQHPITAITGLREELDNIEALDVVHSDKRHQADYYLWKDGNPRQENRVGYFVRACADINEVEICTSSHDIFGVTVDSAGFVGGQDDIPRDIKYCLVVTNGIVHVRCESDVAVGDYVVSNNHGCATKHKSGYKVVGVHDINGDIYAEITLITPIGSIRDLVDNVDYMSTQVDENTKNIAAAMNLANDAYNKASKTEAISEDALRDALEALGKAETSEGEVNKFLDEILPNINESVQQAKAAAESAATSAITAKDEAVYVANDTLANVNNLIEDLEPITTWEDPETGNTGAEYLTTYIKDGVATKAEIQTAEDLISDNTSAIEKSAKEFRTLVASVDKYSVGEYSQAYGLTREQAASILKPGYIYIPTESHSEIMWENSEEKEKGEEGQKEINEFTPSDYYVWGINDQGKADWIEHSVGSVWISNDLPENSNGLYKYGYINSNTALKGYEPYALYIWEDEKWKKVNTLAGNASNRITSMIRQTADSVALEVTNARGSYTGLDARLTETDSQLQLATFWNQPDGMSNLAAVKLDSSDDGSSLALVVMNQDGEQVLKGASIVLGQDGDDSFIHLDADNIRLEGYVTANETFSIDLDGSMTATGGTIGGWSIDKDCIYKNVSLKNHDVYTSNRVVIQARDSYEHADDSTIADDVIVCSLTRKDGSIEYPFSLWKDGTVNCGKLNATGGTVGGWIIESYNANNNFGDNNITIFIGDSYGQGYSPDESIPGGWQQKLGVALWGDSYDYSSWGNSNCWASADGGAGFKSIGGGGYTFRTMFEAIYNNIVDTNPLNNINNVIIGGGFNDRGQSVDDVKEEMTRLDNYVKTNCPNAKITFFAIGWCNGDYTIGQGKEIEATIKNQLDNLYANMSLKSSELGWSFYDIHNWYADVSQPFSSDNIHPTSLGAQKIANVMYNTLTGVYGRLYNDPGDTGFYLSNIKSDPWAIQIGPRDADFTSVGGSSGYRRFLVDRNGELWAQGAHITGCINSESGKIGNWTLQDGLLYSSNDSYASGMASSLGHSGGDAAIWCGMTSYPTPWHAYANGATWTDYCNFYVTNAGYLYAKNAYVEGEIHASNGSFSGTVNASAGYFASGVKVGSQNSPLSTGSRTIHLGTLPKTIYGLIASGNVVIGTENDGGNVYIGRDSSNNMFTGVVIGDTSMAFWFDGSPKYI